MSAQLAEQVFCFVAMGVLVAMFTWIYLRDRRTYSGLWLLGWIAIFLHFAAEMAGLSWPQILPITDWLRIVTLVVAGAFFHLSVSDVFRDRTQRAIFIFTAVLGSVLYWTGLSIHADFPGFHISSWF